MLGLALSLLAAPSQAALIRVTTWDLQPGASAGTNGWSRDIQQSLVREAADSLKKLNPDVIMLQQVADWETCHQLVEALQPESYEVTICSSFRDPRANILGRQIAILSKTKAYLAWSEPWKNSGASQASPGGFAFAAIKLRNRNIGFFSVQFGDGSSLGADDKKSSAWQQAREESARQLVKQIDSLQDWKNNRLQTFIVAGDFDTTPDDLPLVREKTLSLLEQLDFDNAFAGLPLEKRITLPAVGGRSAATLDYVFTRDAGRVDPPQMIPSALCAHAAVTCEMDLAGSRRAIPPPPPPVARAVLPPAQPNVSTTNRTVATPALANTSTPAGNPRTLWWLGGFLAGAVALLFLTRKHARRLELSSSAAAALELKANTSASLAIPQGDPIFFPPSSDSPPYVRIEMEGSSQTQSQTWHPRPDARSATMSGAVREGLIANLSRWFKQKAVQRLVSDRERLLATQQAAGLKVLAVDQRLAKIEHQIQQINHEYERRIDDLLQELVAAKEENRELIRAKIALVKAEMEKARVRAAQHAGEHRQY
jgi:endonuclease/exonuclease/phosphatase family metal-dependent hydrolase